MTKSNQTSMAIVALRESYRPKDINQPSSLNKALKTYFLLGGLALMEAARIPKI